MDYGLWIMDYGFRDFSLIIMLLKQKFWFNSFLKTPKNLPSRAGSVCIVQLDYALPSEHRRIILHNSQ